MPFISGTVRHLLLLLALMLTAFTAQCNHVFGIDLYYTHVSGNTYDINMIIYGDCSGSTFSSLTTATPLIDIYNGSTRISTATMAIQAPTAGIEVTPVCPARAGQTKCTSTSNPLPGIKKFVYKTTVTLPGTSSAWRFLFTGNLSGSSLAGRSTSITNISFGSSGSLIQLVDTLNNTAGPNSSPLFSNIPTPFFCISSAANYNPGAVDPNGDALNFALVPGIDASTGSSVSYIWPYTATAPLGVAAGSFSFNSSNGQLSFTPNITQTALIVYNVREFNGATLKGTCQREMSAMVLSPCVNNPPTAAITSPTAGTLVGSTQINVCNTVDTFRFQLNPTDADGDTISMSASGLPTGSSFTITNNNTRNPRGVFQWVASTATPGTYTFYVTYQDNGCPLSSRQTLAYTIVILPSPNGTTITVVPATCVRRAFVTITPGGPYSPYVISELMGSSSIRTFSGVTTSVTDSLSPGTYTIRTYNPAFCYVDVPLTIATPALPSAIISAAAPLCTGDSTGSLTVRGTAGASPYRYAIGSGSYTTSGNFTGLPTGTYALHIVDSNGCVKDTFGIVPATAPIMEQPIVRKPLCRGINTGRVIVRAYNSVGPYSYAVGSGFYSASDTFSNLAAGTYTFHVMNALGCIDDTTITLTDSLSVHGTLAVAPVACYGGSATVTLGGTGGYGSPYTFAINTGAFGTYNVFTIAAGTYTFHIHDSVGCAFDSALTITQPAVLTATHTVTNISCYGLTNGSVRITASGGTPGYRYAADGGTYTGTSVLTGMAAGSHTLQVRDTNGCIYSDTFTITQPAPLKTDSVLARSPACYGSNNGSIRIYGSGGTPGYTYAINAGSYTTSGTFSTLAAGTYTLHIKDANGCILDTAYTLTQPTPILPAASVTQSLCSTLSNGSVTLSATGGTPAYTYAVGSGTYTTTPTFSSLGAGTYVFHIKDANGCIKDTAITILHTLHISGIFSVNPVLCYGDSSGRISVSGTGGSPAYTYSMGSSAFDTVNTFPHLSAGTYVIHIKDSNGCIGDTGIQIMQPAIVVPHLVTANASCFGLNDASFVVHGTGGVPSYSYSFNGGSFLTTASYSGLPVGTYTVTVKDANGCLADTVFTLTQPFRLLTGSIATTNINCYGGADGQVTIFAAGGTPLYQYSADSITWTATNLFTGLPAGTHLIYIKDNNGCITDTLVTLTEPPLLVFTGLDIDSSTCEGNKDGAVTVHVSGGVSPWFYSADNVTFQSSPVITGLAEGSVTIYIRDAHNCHTDTTITISGYPHIAIRQIDTKTPSCAGAADGVIATIAMNGVPPFTYTINPGGTQVVAGVFTNLTSGNYTVTITDSAGCTRDTTVLLGTADSFRIVTYVTPNNCLGEDNNGSIAVYPIGGTAPYTYVWSNGKTGDSIITGVANQNYTVVVKDKQGCIDSATAFINYDDCCVPFVPNAFSPNADGRNDVFRVKYKGDVRIIEFSVFNRYGERVFMTAYSEDGWDGLNRGEPSEIGVYYYYIRLLCGNLHNTVLEFKGDVTLVR